MCASIYSYVTNPGNHIEIISEENNPYAEGNPKLNKIRTYMNYIMPLPKIINNIYIPHLRSFDLIIECWNFKTTMIRIANSMNVEGQFLTRYQLRGLQGGFIQMLQTHTTNFIENRLPLPLITPLFMFNVESHKDLFWQYKNYHHSEDQQYLLIFGNSTLVLWNWGLKIQKLMEHFPRTFDYGEWNQKNC